MPLFLLSLSHLLPFSKAKRRGSIAKWVRSNWVKKIDESAGPKGDSREDKGFRDFFNPDSDSPLKDHSLVHSIDNVVLNIWYNRRQSRLWLWRDEWRSEGLEMRDEWGSEGSDSGLCNGWWLRMCNGWRLWLILGHSGNGGVVVVFEVLWVFFCPQWWWFWWMFVVVVWDLCRLVVVGCGFVEVAGWVCGFASDEKRWWDSYEEKKIEWQ